VNPWLRELEDRVYLNLGAGMSRYRMHAYQSGFRSLYENRIHAYLAGAAYISLDVVSDKDSIARVYASHGADLLIDVNIRFPAACLSR